jgi:hypothetical protein
MKADDHLSRWYDWLAAGSEQPLTELGLKKLNISSGEYEWFPQHLPAYADCRPIYVSRALQQAGFNIEAVTRKHMWGLPVEICIAKHSKGK